METRELSRTLPLSPLFHKAADGNRPCPGSGVCVEPELLGRRRSLSPLSVSRPCLSSQAAPVRFSNCRTAAKSLPMPEEFPEQHSRSFSDCFETVLCLYFNPAVSGRLTATGLSPAINGKHMCVRHRLAPTTVLLASAGAHTRRKETASRTNSDFSAILRTGSAPWRLMMEISPACLPRGAAPF